MSDSLDDLRPDELRSLLRLVIAKVGDVEFTFDDMTDHLREPRVGEVFKSDHPERPLFIRGRSQASTAVIRQ